MKRILTHFSFVLALIIVSATCVLAAKPLLPGPPIQSLTGEWQTIGTRACVQADVGGGFVAGSQYQLSTHGSTRVVQSTGILSLFGDGTGSWNGKFVQINNNTIAAGSYPVSGFTMECDIAYQTTSDGTIKFEFDNCISTFTAGFYGSETQSGTDNVIVEYARLSADGVTMVMWGLDPGVETIWVTTPGPTTTYYDRICNRTGTAIKFR